MSVMAKALEILLPRGVAWTLLGYGAALKAGIAAGLERLHQAVLDVVAESRPGTATLLLPDWHEAMRIRYDPSRPIAEQRAMLNAEWTSLGGMTLNDLQRQIQKEFPGITIAEVSASGECGEDECGVAICGAGDGVFSNLFYDVLGEVQNDAELFRVATICVHYAAAHLVPCFFNVNVLSATMTSSECGDDICGLAVCEGESGPLAPSFESDAFASGTGIPGSACIAYPGAVVGGPTPTLTYQWRHLGENIDGATSRFFTLPTDLEEGGAYTCEVTATNESGSASSVTNAIVLAGIAPEIIWPAVVVLSGTTLRVDMSVIGAPAPAVSFQWRRDGVNLDGQTSSTYIATEEGEYDCIVTATNSAGSDTKTAEALPVGPPVPWASFRIVEFSAPGMLAIYVSPTSGGVHSALEYTTSYQFRKGGVNYGPAQSGSTLYLTVGETGSFDCVITFTNALGEASATATAWVVD